MKEASRTAENPAKFNRVLIVDDDEINNFICQRNIEETRFADKSEYCLRGHEAINLLKESLEQGESALPDVIFLDINMPNMNAWEFLEEFKKLHPRFEKEVHLFILSSSIYRKDFDRSRHYDLVKGYIVKPLSKEKLKSIHQDHFA